VLELPCEPLALPTYLKLGRTARLVGRALLPIFGHRIERIRQSRQQRYLGYFDLFLLASLVTQHKAAGRLHELADLSERYWASEAAMQYHYRWQQRFHTTFLPHHARIVPTLRRVLAESPATYSALCEIGCGSGLVVNYLVDELPGIEQFVGLDLSSAQIARNRAAIVRPKLRYEAGEAHGWLTEHGGTGWIIFCAGGVLEYLAPERLEALLAMLAVGKRPSLLAIVEALAPQHDLSVDKDSVVFGAENTFSHNYPRLCERAGFEIRFTSEYTTENQRWLALIAEAIPAPR
jgi:predicted TPR repeat methyltransferase